MIGSLMSRMGDAQKLSVEQLQQAIENGTLPAYIGIPLLQDKMQQQKTAQPQQPQQPPIAEQIMQQAKGIDSAPTNLPTEMANGGIVAFAEGDLVEDEDEDEEAEYQQALQMAMQTKPRLNETPRQGISTEQPKAEKFEQPTGIKQINIGKQGKEFYEERYNSLLEKAKDMGFKHPEVIAKLGASQAAVETGFGRSAPNNNYYGIKGAGSEQTTQEYIPGQGMVTIRDSFRSYSNPNASDADYLKLLLNPRYRSVIESEDPNKAAYEVRKSGYATDPNYTNKLASIMASMGKNYADGGIINLASGGGLDEEGNPIPKQYSPEEATALLSKTNPTILTGKDPLTIFGKSTTKPTSTAPAKVTKPAEKPAEVEKKDEDKTEPEAMKFNQFDEFLGNYKQEREALKQQKEEDKYMALLTAGLGMMGGTSPYALTNIGRGAMAGVQDLQQSNKQRAAEKAALDRNYVMGQRYKQVGDLAMMNATTTKEQKEAYARQQQENAEDRRITNQQKADLALLQLGVTQAQIDALKYKREDDKKLGYARLYEDSMSKANTHALNEIKTLDETYKMRKHDPVKLREYNEAVQAIKNNLKNHEALLAPIRELSGLPVVNIPAMAPTVASPNISGLPPTFTKGDKTYKLQPNGKYIEG